MRLHGKKLTLFLLSVISGTVYASVRRVAPRIAQAPGLLSTRVVRPALTVVPGQPKQIAARRDYGDIPPYTRSDYPAEYVQLSRHLDLDFPEYDLPTKVADVPYLRFFASYGKELYQEGMNAPRGMSHFAQDNVVEEYQRKFYDEADQIMVDLNNFYIKGYPQIKGILGFDHKLIKEFDNLWPLYKKNPKYLHAYYHLAYVINKMLNDTFYHNQVQFVAKQIVEENPKGFEVKDVRFPEGKKGQQGYYDEHTKHVAFCQPHKYSMPALQRITIEHELTHAKQKAEGKMSGYVDSKKRAELEHEADRGAASRTKCHVCLAIKRASCRTKAPRSHLGYLSADDYTEYIDRHKEQNLLCKAHGSLPDLVEKIEREALALQPNMDQISRLDRKCGDLYDHFLPYRPQAERFGSEQLSPSGHRLPDVD